MKKLLLCALLGALTLAVPAAADDVSNGSWSTTDGSNNAAPPNGWPAGMFPNQVEPSARSNMGGVKRWWERANAGITTTGSAGAYALTPSNTSYPTAYTQGEIICGKANFTSVGNDTLNVNALGAKALYNNLSRIGAGSIMTGQQFCAAYDGALNSGSGGFQVISGIPISQTLSSRQVLTASSGTYITPAGARQLRVRMVGGGGGGGGGFGTGNGAPGSNGTDTVFNSVHAAGGIGATGGTSSGFGQGGMGTTSGSGSASWRSLGQGGATGANTSNGFPGTMGGSSVLGGGARGGIDSENAPGYGGGGGGGQSGPNGYSGGGGQGGEYVELIITSPSSSYAYGAGQGGPGGFAAGSYTGGDGKQGVIIVDEFY